MKNYFRKVVFNINRSGRLGLRTNDRVAVGPQAEGSGTSQVLGSSWGLWMAGIGAAVAAVFLKLWLHGSNAVPFNSDEAIVALMARHILEGELPLFFYGQAYMGSLDAVLVAGAFRWFGEGITSLRGVQVALFLGTVVSAIVLTRLVFESWLAGIAAGWLLAVPVVTLSLYTTASLGNYGEVLLLGNLILICSIRIAEVFNAKLSNPVWHWLVLGLSFGIGFWAFGLAIVYSLPAVLYLSFITFKACGHSLRIWIRKLAPPGLLIGLGFFLGAIPIWIFIAQEGLSGVAAELAGSAISGVEGLGYAGQVVQHLINMLIFGLTALFGLRPSWEIRWLAVPLAPVVLIFWGGIVFIAARIARETEVLRPKIFLVMGVIAALAAGFILTPFGADPSGRYFLPAIVMFAVLAGGALSYLIRRYGSLAFFSLVLVLIFNLWGTLDSANRMPPGITTQFDPVSQIDHAYDQELIEFLITHEAMRGYTNYWVAYPLAFLSGETILFTPRLPYHQDFRYTERDNRYLPYDEAVENSNETAFITTKHPELDDRLRAGFRGLGVRWEEAIIGDYQIFYHLSKAIRPEDLGMGTTTP